MSVNRLLSVFAFLFVTLPVGGQVATGVYQLGTYDSIGPDTINVGNLNVMLDVPVLHKAGRAGTNFTYDLFYNGSIWTPQSSTSTWLPDSNWGWVADTQILTGYITELQVQGNCDRGGHVVNGVTGTQDVVYTDTFGAKHGFAGAISKNGCTGSHSDTLDQTWSGDHLFYYNAGVISNARGVTVVAPVNSRGAAGTYTDTNGNELSSDGNGNFTDTTGSVALTVSGNAPSNKVFAYTDATGTSRNVTISYTNYTIATNFGCSGLAEYTATSSPLISSITLPDGSSYSFTYEHASGTASGSVTGRLASVTVPSAGVITYTYSGPNGGINCADGSALGLTRTMSSASGTPSRSYSRTINSTLLTHTKKVDELGNDTEFDFVQGTLTGSVTPQFYETARNAYQGTNSGTPLLSKQTCFNKASQPCNQQSLALPITQADTYQTLNGLTQNGTTTTYDAYLEVIGVTNYDYGTATARGSQLQAETLAYSSGLVQSDITKDPAGNTKKTTYGYDVVAATATSGVLQHATPSSTPGNLTRISQYDFDGTLKMSRILTYYDTGSVSTDLNQQGTKTTYAYDSTYTHATTVTPSDPNSVGLSTSIAYDSYLGAPISATDPNGTLGSVATSDAFGRPTEVDVKQAGTTLIAKTTASYSPTKSTSVSYQSSSVSAESDTYYDAYGRPIRTASQSGGGVWYVADTCYDAYGRAHFQSYPYSTSSLGAEVCSGLGDTTTYDALGRVLSVTHGDSAKTTVSYAYNGAATQRTDENNVGHIYQVDGLGRQTITCEISATALQGVAPTSCGTTISGTGFVTTYTSNLKGTTITQGAQTRAFVYDGLGRMTAKTEPEAPGNGGASSTLYSYTQNSTGWAVTRTKLAANQTSLTQTTTTVTQYDVLGRPISITYNDGVTPTKTYSYDAAPSGSSFNVGSAKGQLTSASTGTAGATSLFGYDAMGRVNAIQQCIPGQCSTPALNIVRSYTYNWAGRPQTEQYSTPSGNMSLTYGVNLAGQLTSVTGGQDKSLSSLFLATTLTAYGPTAASLGNGVTESMSYDVFGRPSGLGLTLGSTALYAYTATWKGPLVTGSSDSVNGSGMYAYDNFNRLQMASMSTSRGSLNLGWTYDQYGNRLSQTASGSYTGSVSQPSYSINTASNRIMSAGFSYDAAGNLMTDGTNTYTYDAEGNITAISGGTTAAYTYDALNQRVRTTVNGTTRAFGFNAARQRATVWDGSGNLISAQYYDGSHPLAYWLASDGHVRFQHQDWVGTERFRTTYTGAMEGTFTSQPFGDGKATASGSDTDPYHYADLDSDTQDLQHATYREASAVQGRWLRPDPYMGSYNFIDPQSFNRYSYVENSPLSFTDAMGLDTKIDPLKCYSFDTDGNPMEVVCDGGGDIGGTGVYDVNASTGGGVFIGSGTSTTSLGQQSSPGSFGAPSNAQQQIAKQITTVNNCTSQANAAMNAGPSVAPTGQNVIDGVVAATFTIATDGAATALSVLTNFFKGSAVRSVGHAAQNGITFLTTYHGCLATAGQGSPYNPYSPF